MLGSWIIATTKRALLSRSWSLNKICSYIGKSLIPNPTLRSRNQFIKPITIQQAAGYGLIITPARVSWRGAKRRSNPTREIASGSLH